MTRRVFKPGQKARLSGELPEFIGQGGDLSGTSIRGSGCRRRRSPVRSTWCIALP